MKKFSKLVLNNGIDKITIKPIVKGVKPQGFKVTEEKLAYYHRGGILPQTEETVFDEYSDVENYVDGKTREGYELLVTL